ncbi:hypothetical protein RD792_016343 [Penstemon davidsonii]|uniref:S-protein homolog n=1 Tax=Penstemon davidsonii TaxID=160366 RepID=A0ABR0CJ21_9LAMI|nr:hypothetical protein RD792_016343 [Penstemon davidsonii]
MIRGRPVSPRKIRAPNSYEVAIGARRCFFGPLYHYRVHLVNSLAPNTKPSIVTVHCASGNDDLGNHTLALNQEFSFDFCSIPFKTLFFCHFWWGNKNKAFDAFDDKRPCGERNCYWFAKNDGIWLSEHSDPNWALRKLFDWE